MLLGNLWAADGEVLRLIPSPEVDGSAELAFRYGRGEGADQIVQRRGRLRGGPGSRRRYSGLRGLAMAVRYDARTHPVHTRGRPLHPSAHGLRERWRLPAHAGPPRRFAARRRRRLALLSVTEAETAGLASPTVWMGIILAILAAVAFTWHIRTAREPFVAPCLFASSTFLAAIFVGFLAQFANIGSLFLAPLLLEGSNGLSPAQAGMGPRPPPSWSRPPRTSA